MRCELALNLIIHCFFFFLSFIKNNSVTLRTKEDVPCLFAQTLKHVKAELPCAVTRKKGCPQEELAVGQDIGSR